MLGILFIAGGVVVETAVVLVINLRAIESTIMTMMMMRRI
jgi:hypothetical protein